MARCAATTCEKARSPLNTRARTPAHTVTRAGNRMRTDASARPPAHTNVLGPHTHIRTCINTIRERSPLCERACYVAYAHSISHAN
eukprot:6210029-Pleurochrysis_carterae.AAC.1